MNGTPEAQVTFTDIGDDTRGGDTSADEASRTPAAGYWAGITIDGSKAHAKFEHAQIRFASTAIAVDSCSPEMSYVTLKDNGTGVSVVGSGANPSISESRIFDNTIGATATGEAELDATRNWWGAADGPQTETLAGSGSKVSGNVNVEDFLTSDPDM